MVERRTACKGGHGIEGGEVIAARARALHRLRSAVGEVACQVR